MKYGLIILVSFFVQFIFGQNGRLVSKVYLKNKSKYIGYLSQDRPDYYTLDLKDGSLKLQIPISEIKRIVQVDPTLNFRPIKPYEFKETGMYNVTYTKLNSGYDINRKSIYGYGFEIVTGLMMNRFFGIGIGLGYEHLGTTTHNSFYPVFAETRGYLLGRQTSYYYSISVGYSFIGRANSLTITQSNGGLLFHPALGIRFGGKKHFNTCLDFGFRIQGANWLYEPQNSWLKSERIDYIYKRFVIRLGIQI